MRVSPVVTGSNTVGAISGDAAPTPSLRTIKMATNATPGQVTSPGQVEELPGLQNQPGTEEATTPAEATQAISPQMAALAKERRQLQLERQAFEKEKAEKAQLSTQDAGIDRARFKSEPLKVLLEEGVTYDQLTEAILAQQNGSNEQAIKDQLKALEDRFEKKLSDKDAQAEQQVLAEMRRDAAQLIATGDTYELVRETRSLPDVMKLIEATYRKEGWVMDVSDALQEVEDYLEGESLKLARLGKVQSKLAPQPMPTQAPQPRQSRTLTNRDTASMPLSPKARALAAFNGTLKK